MRRIRASNLLIIDEVGYLPINATEGNLFFQLITELQELRKEELMNAVINSDKSYEEILAFVQGKDVE